MSDQLFEVNNENNMSFEYEGINNFEHNFDNNHINNENVFRDKNDNYNEGDYHTDDDKGNTVNFLPITSYFSPTSPIETSKKKTKTNIIHKKESKLSDNEEGTSKWYKTVFQPKTSTTNITAHLCTEHRIFKTQKWNASPITTVNPTSVTQPTIEPIIQKQIENTLPLSKKQQSHIAYQLVAWIVEEMMPLNSIRQLGTPHLGCIAHTIHLVVTDKLKQCETLIGHTKSLNNFLNSTYLVLQRLLEFRKLILELATNLTNNSNHTIHADDNNLNEKILTDEEWTS
ncbi:19404_t:CDS:2 [Cetraspora pellucida]|uniref:19404_t:CDS:1 n=1 Tax=Cetraspora pellucida TaxID=1433469 RepID=A0A9N9JV31_9GLOM|nr:19404_t:CDS:2 [Cetraspora pellucida]